MENKEVFYSQGKLDFLSGGGEMGSLIRSTDWLKTSLGPVINWTPSLRSALSICLESAFPIALYWGKDLTLLYNNEWKPILGNKHPWALGRSGHDVWPEIWEDIEPLFRKVITTGEGIRNKDGLLLMNRHGYTEECYFDFTFSPVRGEDGKVEGIFNAVVETTYRVISERRANHLKNLSEKLNQGKSIEEVSFIASEVLKHAPEDVSFCLLYALKDDSHVVLKASAGISSENPACPKEISLTDKDKAWPVSTSSLQPVLIQDLNLKFSYIPGGKWPEPSNEALIVPLVKGGKVFGFFICGISPRRKLDREYQNFIEAIANYISVTLSNVIAFEEERQRTLALAEIDKAKTIFFSNVSHEFRTPLTLMLGPIEDALNDTDTIPVNMERMKIAHNNSLRLLKLVNTLLDFSRIEAGRIQALFIKTNICLYVKDLCSSFRSAAEKAGIKLNVECEEISDEVYVDRTMWERIVFNLLSNALKFTFQGEILVQVKQVGKQLELSVKDTGIGIPNEELPKLFSRFHRIENVRGRTHEGTGIGLAMVYELVKLHGGKIEVESTLGKDSVFKVTIPTGKSHLPENEIGQSDLENRISLNAVPDSDLEVLGLFREPWNDSMPLAINQQTSRKDRIIIADDNSDMREYLTKLLKNQFEVTAVKDGIEAYEELEKEPPSLILSDIMMPNLDGFGLLNKVRSDKRFNTIPVIFISARAGEEARIEGVNAGADDYIVKPFSAKELIARVTTQIKLTKARFEADKALRKSEERQRALLTATSSVIYRMSPDWSEMWQLTGNNFLLDTGESIKDWMQKYIPKEDQKHVLKFIQEAIKNKSVFELEHPVIQADGSVGWTFSRAVPILDDHGNIEEWFGMASDVTTRKQTEKILKEREEHYRFISNTTPVMLWITDKNSRCTFINQTWVDFTGQPYEEAIKFGWLQMVHIDDREMAEKTFMEATRKLEPFSIDYRLRKKDGQYCWANYSGAPLIGAHGEFLGYTGYAIEISERKNAEEALAKSNRELTKINNDLDNFIYTASHDLKAPVSNIEGLINSLKDNLKGGYKESEEDVEQILQMVDSSISRFKNTIQDLTDISKVQKVAAEDVKEINCEQVIEDVKLMILDKIVESKAEIKSDTSRCNTLQFSKKNFNSIVYNLLSNALKYRDPNRSLKIEIITEKIDNYFVLTVKDNGLGISKSNKSKLFGMFKRFHDHIEGSGIGLYIVKRIVDNAGGKIEVESEVGKGTTFKVSFKC